MSEDGDWKQYEMLAETVRHSTELVLKLNIFFYAVTGAILSFYFSRPEPVPQALRFVLAFPACMGVALAIMCARAGTTISVGEAALGAIGQRLGLTAYPGTTALRGSLFASAAFFALVAVGLIILMIFADRFQTTQTAPGGI